ncbi:hypothetical protein BDB00DRAFT_784819 [Zychaea mexicana]|uniref:uncharacterized protein n=1 Tax=Zychaea mexicana TaxID=64656 RepID=UPI0022FE73C6|nr:uncharacterized protein BDB00DRAFT_784819 [Zychaea mexicana]KAI9497491.1 hypothetical protein BDB00DRAFT_784819 [Zychaea mexicana]
MTSLAARIQDQASLYRKLSDELAQEHTISMGLESCLAERDRLTQRIKSKQVELGTLTENSKKEFDDLRKIRHLSIRSAAATLTGKKREKAAVGEARYQQAFESEQRCKRDIEQMSNELGVLSDNQQQLERQADHIRETRNQFKRLLDDVWSIMENRWEGEKSRFNKLEKERTIFTVTNPSYPLEPQLKAEVQNYINQKAAAARDLDRFKDTDHNLSHAKRDINKVLRLINTSISYVPFDLFGGNLMDANQAACLEGAKKQTYEVQRRLNVARQILPEIPHPGLLDVVSNNLLLSMQVNFNYVDVAWKAKAQHTYALLATCQKNIDTSLHWVRHYLRYTEGALQRLDVAINSTQNALENERRRIADGVLSGQPVDGMAGGVDEPDDQPPPMYESPPDANAASITAIPSIPSDVHLPPPSPTSTLENGGTLTPFTTASSSNSASQRPPSQPPAPYPLPSPPSSSSTPYVTQNTHNPFR